jgi:hypothetical protein
MKIQCDGLQGLLFNSTINQNELFLQSTRKVHHNFFDYDNH